MASLSHAAAALHLTPVMPIQISLPPVARISASLLSSYSPLRRRKDERISVATGRLAARASSQRVRT